MKIQTIFYAFFILLFGGLTLIVHMFRYLGLILGGRIRPNLKETEAVSAISS